MIARDEAYSPFHVDRRRGERLPLQLPARIARGDGETFLAETTCLSIDGAAFNCGGALPPGELVEGEIVGCLVGGLGLVSGRVARFADEEIAVAFAKEGRAARVAALIRLERLLAGEEAELRAHARILPPPDIAVALALPRGASEPAEIVDLSLGGARLRTAARPMVGARVRLGPMPARVVRHAEDGIAVLFTGP